MPNSINLSRKTEEWMLAFCKAHNIETLHKGLEKLIDCYKAWNTTCFHGKSQTTRSKS